MSRGEKKVALVYGLALILVLVLYVNGFCGSVTFGWTDPPETDLATVQVHASNQAGSYNYEECVCEAVKGTQTCTWDAVPEVTGPDSVTWYFVATALDQAGNRSEASNEVSISTSDTTPTSAPGAFQIAQHEATLQTVVTTANAEGSFYSLVITKRIQ